MNPSTPQSHFEDKPMLFHFMAESAIIDKSVFFPQSKDDENWFIEWVDCRLRWLHANRKDWHKILERQNNKDRDTIVEFIGHWANAFVLDQEKFKQQNPIMD